MMGGETPLSDRSRTLFAIIAAAAEEGAVTPSTAELTATLQAAGHRIGDNPGLISYELRRLRRAGLITVIGRRRRIFEVAATGRRTVPRRAGRNATQILALVQAKGRLRMAQAGWPRPTKDSAASYDAAVRRREFAKHEHPERSGPVVRIGPPAQWSPTGCATAMMALW
jgi:DNA-binding PadR family transcriptional regulator